jgi:hypothetical protein
MTSKKSRIRHEYAMQVKKDGKWGELPNKGTAEKKVVEHWYKTQLKLNEMGDTHYGCEDVRILHREIEIIQVIQDWEVDSA